jgi:hypothetical protein
MITEYSDQLKNVYLKYNRLHNELSNLEKLAQDLSNKQAMLSQELDDNRKTEKFLINKIEETINRKITQEDLMQIINTNE